jgi:hypothetical protein
MVFGLGERAWVVELYVATAMSAAWVVEHPGCPTGRCLERRPTVDPRHACRMAEPVIALEARGRAIGLVSGGMRQRRAAGEPGAGIGAVHDRVGAYRGGGMAALQPRNRNAARKRTPVSSSGHVGDGTGALRRRVGEPELRNALMREVTGIVKRIQAPARGAFRTGGGPGRSTGCARRFHRAVWPAGRRSPRASPLPSRPYRR